MLAKTFINRIFLKPVSILLIPVFLSCETADDIGIEYQLDDNVNVRLAEFILPATNVYIDSLRTDGENQIVVGKYTDAITGSIEAEGYFQYSYLDGPLPRGTYVNDTIIAGNDTTIFKVAPEDTLVYSSMSLVLSSDNWEGSVNNLDIGLYELQNEIQNNLVYLSNNQQTKGEFLGNSMPSIELVIDTSDVITDTTIVINYNEEKGLEFFNLISSISLDSTESVFTYNYTDLVITVGSTTSEFLALISTNFEDSYLTLFSTDTAQRDTIYETRFGLFGNEYFYLKRNRNGSEFDGIENTSGISLESGKTVIDPLAGITTSVNVEEVKNFFQQDSTVLISSATIIYEFDNASRRDTINGFYDFFAKKSGGINGSALRNDPYGNIILNDLAYLSPTLSPGVSTSSLNSDSTSMLLNATLFFQSYYRSFLENDSLLFNNPIDSDDQIPITDLVTISADNVNLDQTIFKKDGIKLRIYYTQVDSDE